MYVFFLYFSFHQNGAELLFNQQVDVHLRFLTQNTQHTTSVLKIQRRERRTDKKNKNEIAQPHKNLVPGGRCMKNIFLFCLPWAVQSAPWCWGCCYLVKNSHRRGCPCRCWFLLHSLLHSFGYANVDATSHKIVSGIICTDSCEAGSRGCSEILF